MIFDCKGAALAGWLHEADGTTGILIVQGGGQTRVGPQRLFARLAAGLSAAGYPVLRFDRRGIGDSGGEDAGFEGARADIEAAAAALRQSQPQLTALAGLGLCDGATALLDAAPGLDGLVLLNPWTIEEGAPPTAAAVKHHYRSRMMQPAAWKRALAGKIDLRSALASIAASYRKSESRGEGGADTSLEDRVAAKLAGLPENTLFILSRRDRTAMTFAEGAGREVPAAQRLLLDADHAFSAASEYWALTDGISAFLRERW